jgi:hypothetical protein
MPRNAYARHAIHEIDLFAAGKGEGFLALMGDHTDDLECQRFGKPLDRDRFTQSGLIRKSLGCKRFIDDGDMSAGDIVVL